MDIKTEKVTKLVLSKIDRLDPVTVFAEDICPNQGKITITCYGEAWTAYFGSIGDSGIADFICSCDESYLAGKLSDIESNINDIDAIKKQADEKGIECWRDDPWNDYEFLSEMYGPDMMEWSDSLPKKKNHKYTYLCRIIKAVQDALKRQSGKMTDNN